MKVNTKKISPLSPASPTMLMNVNTHIPKSDMTADEGDLGRQVKYEPCLIFSPVMSSDRTKRNSPTNPRFSKGGVDELCSLLTSVFIKEANEEDNIMKPDKTQTLEVYEKKFGRFETSIATKTSTEPVTVCRSARLTSPLKQ